MVVTTLVQLLEELARPYKGIHTHPVHVLRSELYVVELLANCFSDHWSYINTYHSPRSSQEGPSSESESSSSESVSKHAIPLNGGARRASRNKLLERNTPPQPLDDVLVGRLIDAVKIFTNPVSENYILPSANILDDKPRGLPGTDVLPSTATATNGQYSQTEAAKLMLEKINDIDIYTRNIIEYVSFSNWPRVLEYLRSALRGLRAAHPSVGNPVQTNQVAEDDRNALITIRLISAFWVDGRKLGVIIQELCGSFLHLRKAFQTAVAIVLPMLITRWLERNPEEFVNLHTMHDRLDGGAETLFDMTNTMIDGSRRKALLFPFQMSLLFLLPDVFEVASNMRDIKSTSMSKKVSFLETLRKSLRNRNEAAIYCLTSVLRAARHFSVDSDAALPSYALDVQEEVREAVFRRNPVGADSSSIDHGLMTAAFVSLAHLDFESCVDNLVPMCLAPNTPVDFKIAVLSACSHFARQSNAVEYRPLFSKVAGFLRTQIKVSAYSCKEAKV